MTTSRPSLRKLIAFAIAAGALVPAPYATAGSKRFDVGSPAYRQECGSCHVPFPPALLSAPSWRAVMQGLPTHFGTDASVDPVPRAEIAAFLESHAGTRDTSEYGKPLLRLSRTTWFAKEHRKHVAPPVLARPEVKSIANCAACHPGAEQGRYDERDIRIPGGGAK